MVFSIVIPPVTYILMGQLFGGNTYAGNLNYAEMYTPSFILLITFSVIFFAFGFDQVVNRTNGVEKRISISPVPKRILLISSILKSIIITSFGFFFIQLIGIVVYGLSFHSLTFLTSYGFFIILNTVLLVISSAIYSIFQEMKSALVFSIIIFQLVMFTGDFSLPVSMMPKFIQAVAQLNPLYHMNHLFIDIWNQQFVFNKNTWISISYVLLIFIISLFVLQFSKRKSVK